MQPATPTRHTEPLCTIREAEALLGVHRATIRRYVASGILPVVQYGPRGRFRFRRADLERLLEPRGAGGGPP